MYNNGQQSAVLHASPMLFFIELYFSFQPVLSKLWFYFDRFWSKVKSADEESEVICIFIRKSLTICHLFWSNCISEYYEPMDNQKRAINLIIYFSHRNQIFYNRNLEIIPLQENVNRPKKRIVQLPILWMFISLHLSDFLQNIHRTHPVVFSSFKKYKQYFIDIFDIFALKQLPSRMVVGQSGSRFVAEKRKQLRERAFISSWSWQMFFGTVVWW